MERTNVLFLLTPKNQVACLVETMNVRQALEKMKAHGYMAIPLISNGGEYIGTISEGDLLWYIARSGVFDYRKMEETKITELLRKGYAPAVKVDAGIEEIVDNIVNYNFIPVVDDRNVLMGIVTRKRVLQELLKSEA
ncbi:MAG: CBS domain-containing protein [Erysipelotrichaceae bacterium]|nr:CBS domain-containing protein [Erysipelotrichaceae bacterium]